MPPLRISLLQIEIAWENKKENLRCLREKLETLRGATEVVILPETFSTGFCMNTATLAEAVNGETLTALRQWSSVFQVAIAGSYIACQEDSTARGTQAYYNRAFFLTPEGDAWYYNKRHLFRMGSETEYFTAGQERPIIHYKGWNILLLVCYDLRFPVWSRNVGNEYDLLIYVANWPSARRKAWDVLLQARALENSCYVCGVNRVGTDGNHLPHSGGSVVHSPKGECLATVPDNEEGVVTTTLDLETLKEFRQKFPTWRDADKFELKTQ